MPFALKQYLQSIPRIDLDILERAASDIESHKSGTNLSQTLQEYPDFLLYTINAFTFHAHYADKYEGDPAHLLRRVRAGNLWRRWICLADKFSWDTTLLHFAAEHNLVSWIKCLLLMGADPDETGGEYRYPLMAAVVNHHKEATMMLVKRGANTDCWTKTLKPPLHYIAEEGSTEFLDCFLLNMPARKSYYAELLYARDDLRRTPLHLAAQKGHHSMCEKLLELGADANCYDYNEKSALHYAAESEESSMAVCQLLLQNGALRDATTREFRTPAQLALQKGHLDRLALIEDYQPCQKGHVFSPSAAALEVRLVKFLGKGWLKQPYVQVCFAGQKKTLYPRKTSRDTKGWTRASALHHTACY
jgi:ankyrin repeat protein